MHGGVVRFAGLLLVLAGTQLSGSPALAANRPATGELSPRLAELARPAVRAAPRRAQARRLGVAVAGAGSLQRQGRRVLVEVRFEAGAPLRTAALRAAGARVLHVSRRYWTVTVALRPSRLRGIAAVPGVQAASEVLAPIVAATSCGGLVGSEGDAQLRSDLARTDFNVDGQGVTVGLLSDSFDRDAAAPTRAADDTASGDLPGPGNPCGRATPVGILDDGDFEGADEGRAMAQIVHDLAPGAGLSFASATLGELAFADSIRALAGAGADVLVDDIIYFEEPFFQDGPVAVAVNQVTAAGVSYFSAAGNDNLIDGGGNEIGSWEADAFRPIACPAGLPPFATQCMDFDPGAASDSTFAITVEAKATLRLSLQWAQPWFGVATDLDGYLLLGGTVVAPPPGGEVHNVADTEKPVEVLAWTNPSNEPQTVELAIDRCDTACDAVDGGDTGTPRLKFVLLQNGGGVGATEYPQSQGGDAVGPTVFGHSAAAAAVSVGAVRFSDASKPEDFSSRGPATHYFEPVGSTVPAEALSAPQQISKPDLVATDGGANTFFGQNVAGVWRFFGTSASAPHAAAVAALMKEANPGLSLGQLRLALAATARPVGAFGPDAVGAGLLDAYGAIGSVALPPTVSITERPPPLGNDPRPAIGFLANRPATFACMLDGGGPQSCASPFVPATRLADGAHGFVVTATDAAGRIGQSELVSFEIDTRPPRTFFRRRPPRTIRTRHRRVRAVFRFGANEADATFICRVDGGLPRFCKRRLARRFRVGRHVVRVRARDAAGNLDRTPAVHRFRVKRIGA